MDIRVLKVGDIIEGKVVAVTDKTIFLDVQYFTEARIHIDNYDPELESFDGVIKVGDLVKGRIQKISLDEPALILMSRLPLIKIDNFEKIREAVESKEIVSAKVKKVVDKGLLLSYLDYEVFLPFTLLDYEYVEQKDKLKNKNLDVNIIEATKKGRFTRIVASRKEIFEKERKELYEKRLQERQSELDSIQTGDVLKGTVDKIEKHAANIRFDHVVGLLRISQVSHYRIEKIEDVLTLGDEIEVKVIKKEGNRLDLSIKALEDTPFEKFAKSHNIGDTVSGTVNQKLPFGIIVEVDRDVRGLLHKNEYSWNPNDNYDDFVKIGDQVTLKVIGIDKKNEKISLSKKALEDNPWKNVTVKRGEVVKAVVSKVSGNGLEVEVQGVNGFIPANEVEEEKLGQIEAYYSIGDEVEALVTEANNRNWSLKLSIKAVQTKKERETFEKYLEDDSEDVGQTIGDLFADELKK
ncbi:S1 RNA-binding domain-containing protein [Haploplasma axanthum]|uniref:30S ribosomal protein S1 n=1 Tax=Haploplasma axanthum TaxID=29552 RepID=A0A449BE10_HAPAX|nr:S1 RNA-binding domain-containing protein [Haploplasma axanthum]VEU80694.1 30S ribosomal protein S1 [Haploplasma axanthum]